MSFKVGDEVFLKCRITGPQNADGYYSVSAACMYHASNLIPASRVTVAKARRAATKEDAHAGKYVYFIDGEGIECYGRLVGYDHTIDLFVVNAGGYYNTQTAEVEV